MVEESDRELLDGSREETDVGGREMEEDERGDGGTASISTAKEDVLIRFEVVEVEGDEYDG